MPEEIEKVEVARQAECARSTGTVINEKGATLSECATSPTAVDNHEAPSEVDQGSRGHEGNPVQQNSQAPQYDNRPMIAEYTARFDTQSLEGRRYNSRRIATSNNNKL